MTGKTLLVPVESGRTGTATVPLQAARLVPSPPRMTRHCAPRVSMMPRREGGVGLVVADGHFHRLHGDGRGNCVERPGHDGVAVRHVQDLGHPGLFQAEDEPPDHAHLLLVVEDGTVGHQAADVLSGGGIGQYGCDAQWDALMRCGGRTAEAALPPGCGISECSSRLRRMLPASGCRTAPAAERTAPGQNGAPTRFTGASR